MLNSFAPSIGAIMEKNEHEKLFSTSEAAAFLGVTAGYVRRLVRTGKLKAIKIDNFHAFRQSDLEAWDQNERGKVGRPYKDS